MSAERTLALIEARIAAIPAELHGLLQQRPAPTCLPVDDPFVVAGIGGSQGPARLLTWLLRRLQRRVEIWPLSRFIGDFLPQPATLILFSQGLSPNAQLALRARHRFRRVLVFTSLGPEREGSPRARQLWQLLDEGGEARVLPPAAEPDLLLRLVGPMVAMVEALRFALQLAAKVGDALPYAADDLTTLPELVAGASQRLSDALSDDPPSWPLALITGGGYHALGHGLSWKWLEGLCRGQPPLWDLLQLVHGPFQSFYHQSLTLLALTCGEATVERDLLQRLERMIDPGRHRLHRLHSALPAPLSLIDHDAQLNELLLRTLRRQPIDLTRWPGQQVEGPLYRLGAED